MKKGSAPQRAAVSRSQAARLKAALGGASFPPLSSGPVVASPTASGSRASYLDVASGRSAELAARKVSPYLKMLADPFPRENAIRYPDETIVPTALTHLAASKTFLVPAEGTVAASLGWKATTVAGGGGCVGAPGPLSSFVTTTDYGLPQASYEPVSTIDRTLACAIRARLIGLPVSTFMPSGTLYFFQVQQHEWLDFVTSLQGVGGETVAIQAVTAGKGFAVTANELSRTDGLHISYLPQGPMSFVFSNTGSVPAGTDLTFSNMSSNGNLLVVGFGMNEGQLLRFDYTHHVEYVPRFAAAGLIQTSVEPPSAPARDAIARGAAYLQQSRSGATTVGENPGATTSGLGRVLQAAGRVAVGMLPGAGAALGAVAGLAEGLGAPSWLTSAARSLL